MAAKQPAYDRQLHFFPGAHQIIWLPAGKAPLVAKAWGGENADPTIKYNVMKPRPTTPGRYIIHSYAPYRTNTWPMSRIPWGTKLTLDAKKQHLLYETGLTHRPWMRVEDKIPDANLEAIKQLYRDLYGVSSGSDVPKSWVFNDFGPWAVRYFRDRNSNRKLDKGERLSGEMIHTTPEDEADVTLGNFVNLMPSHGCIHVDPKERDQLHMAGAFDRGIELIIHPYSETVPPDMK
ncbi:MAG: hypothetical protein ABJA82_04650 [Myxococcales bacterium]